MGSKTYKHEPIKEIKHTYHTHLQLEQLSPSQHIISPTLSLWSVGLASYSTYYELCILERIKKMKGKVEEQLPFVFSFVIANLEILHQNLEFPRN